LNSHCSVIFKSITRLARHSDGSHVRYISGSKHDPRRFAGVLCDCAMRRYALWCRLGNGHPTDFLFSPGAPNKRGQSPKGSDPFPPCAALFLIEPDGDEFEDPFAGGRKHPSLVKRANPVAYRDSRIYDGSHESRQWRDFIRRRLLRWMSKHLKLDATYIFHLDLA
jgi:hypothetical protein